jgi:hypothetical protein
MLPQNCSKEVCLLVARSCRSGRSAWRSLSRGERTLHEQALGDHSRKVPRLNRDIWERLLDAHGGDANKAKTALDRLVKREADRLLGTVK